MTLFPAARRVAAHLATKASRSCSGPVLPCFCPSTGNVLAEFPQSRPEEVAAAVTIAGDGFRAWANTTEEERASALEGMEAIMASNRDMLAHLESLDVGKPLRESYADIDDSRGALLHCARLIREQGVEVVDLGNSTLGRIDRLPVGVVGGILPWNYPILMFIWKLAPAVAAASEPPLPSDAFQLLIGDGGVGANLVKAKGVNKVSFTGSRAAGEAIMKAAATGVRPVTLELGGKCPAIVFDDCNVAAAVEGLALGGYWNAGQICSATSLVLVQEGVMEEVEERLLGVARAIKVGAPWEEGVTMGPLATAAQMKKVYGLVEKAHAAGATTLTGLFENGHSHLNNQGGYFLPPTLMKGVTPDMDIFHEEVFGPVVTLVPFSTEEQAIEIANGTEYGLAAAVFSGDEERLERVSRCLQAGTVWNNTSQFTFPEMPWGGMKASGIGRELGPRALSPFQVEKSIIQAPATVLGLYE